MLTDKSFILPFAARTGVSALHIRHKTLCWCIFSARPHEYIPGSPVRCSTFSFFLCSTGIIPNSTTISELSERNAGQLSGQNRQLRLHAARSDDSHARRSEVVYDNPHP